MSVYDIDGNNICFGGGEDVSDLDGILPNRLLIWHDEFDKPFIDRSKWANIYGKPSVNNYLHYPESIDGVANSGSGLSYRAIKDNPNVADGFTYSAAFLWTNNLFEFMYGRIEAKIKFPTATPHHSTLWTLGANTDRKSNGEYQDISLNEGVAFPSCGEIDIAEYDSGSVGFRTHWATQGFDTTANADTGGNINSLTSTPNNWHVYACEWTADTISIYVDGVLKKNWSTSESVVNGWNPFQHPHFLILNCIVALSGTPSWEIAETNVKWVRVYAPVGVTERVVETAISIPASASIAVNERHYLSPTFTPANPSDMTLKWLSHDPEVVTCYGGMLIGKKAGTTYVQATTKNGLTAFCKVTVS